MKGFEGGVNAMLKEQKKMPATFFTENCEPTYVIV